MSIALNAAADGLSATLQLGGTNILTIDANKTAAATGKALEATSGPSTSAFGAGRNRIINGGMEFDQRNNGAFKTIPASTTNFYTLDRWACYVSGSSTSDVQRVIGGLNNSKLLQFNGTAGVTGADVYTRIESQNIKDLAGKSVTISFDIADSTMPTVQVSVYSANAVDNFSAVTLVQAVGSIPITSTLTRHSVQINLNAACANGIEVQFNYGAKVSGTTKLGRVQLEEGSVATPFSTAGGSYGAELALCQRYYQQQSGGQAFLWQGASTSGSGYAARVYLPVSMRIAPTATASIDAATSFPLGNIAPTNIDTTGFAIVPLASATVSNSFFRGSFTASAEL
jgi:hypothetical protein